MSPFIMNIVATAVILLFGAGVVAGSFLCKFKFRNSSWFVAALCWAVAVTFAVFSTGFAIRSIHANLAMKAIAIAILVFALLFIGTNKTADRINPLIAGFLIFAPGLSSGGPAGYALNPARDLAPRIMCAIFAIPGKGSSGWKYSWAPVVGLISAGVLGALVVLICNS